MDVLKACTGVAVTSSLTQKKCEKPPFSPARTGQQGAFCLDSGEPCFFRRQATSRQAPLMVTARGFAAPSPVSVGCVQAFV